MKSTLYFWSFSRILAVAELLLETTATVFPLITALAIRLRMVWVLPVPGGPSITLICSFKAFSVALF